MTYTKAGPSRGRSTAQAATQSLFWSLCFRRGDAVGALRGGGDRTRAGDVGDVGDLGSDAAVPDRVADGGGGDRQTTSSSLVSAGLLPAAAAARRGGGGGVDGLRAVEDLAVQDSPGASAAPADRVGGGGDRQTTSSSSSSSGAFMPTRATAARDDRRGQVLPAKSVRAAPGGRRPRRKACATRATAARRPKPGETRGGTGFRHRASPMTVSGSPMTV